ncbi:hypothetical protein BY996DRAFT_4055975 [Phakopsora pachyrhizi]|nr:hypothetical protein BY996DRAFT_4055975 [Phakopsora pachyrhizi]
MLSLGSSLFEKTAEIENPSPFSCTAASSAISAQSPHTAQNFSTSNSSNYSHYPVSIPNSNSVANFDWPNPFSNASGVIDDGCSANYSQALPMTYNHMVNTQITSSMADIQGAIGSSDQVLKFAQSDPQSLDFLMHQNYIPEKLDSQPLRETSLKARGATVDFTPNYRATHSNINRYSWDEAAGRISNASISSSINEPRRESDPLPVAPIPQRPWNSKYSCSNESLSCNTKQFATLDVPALNRIGAPPDGSISGNPLSSNQNDSFSANPTCKTSAVLDMNSVLSLEDEKLEYNAESSLNPRYHSLLRFQNGENSKEGAPLVSGRDFSSVTTGRSANIPDVENINLNNKCESTQETNNNNNNYMGFPLSSSHFEPCHQTVSQEQQIDPSHLEFFNLGRTIPLYTHTAPHRSISPYAPPGHVPSAPEFHDLSNHRSMGVPVSTSASCTHRLPEISMEVSQQQQPIRLRRLTMMTRPLYSETRQIQECVTASEEPKEGSILKIISPQNNFHSYSERKRKVNSADRQLMEDFLLEEPNAPLYGESEKYNQSGSTESFSSSEVKTPTDETPDEEKTGRSQYEPMRFGGIGQGKSPFPPGLDGKLRPSSEDFEEAVDEDGESVVPWKQELRCDEDLYTPIWCRGQNDKKEGFCDMCDGGAWFRLKNSAYWYHKQYFHGVSSTTGHYFYPPKEIKRGLSTANRQQILGLCHECEEWVGYSSVIGNQQCKKKPKTDGKVSTLWYKHAHKCHRHQTCKGAKGRKKAKKSLERVDGVLSNKKFRFQS